MNIKYSFICTNVSVCIDSTIIHTHANLHTLIFNVNYDKPGKVPITGEEVHIYIYVTLSFSLENLVRNHHNIVAIIADKYIFWLSGLITRPWMFEAAPNRNESNSRDVAAAMHTERCVSTYPGNALRECLPGIVC